mgnify:CR=1 FL=1|jgi:hypothetical protein
MKSRLKNTLCYLCGAMDRVPDGGAGWRNMITPVLKDMNVGVLDPCNKPTDFACEDDQFRDMITILKSKGKFNDVREFMRDIAAIDLRMVDIAHFVIMYMDIDIHMCGSYHEASVAIQQKKPLLVVCKQGKENVPNWLFGVMPHQHMFSTWQELICYLGDVHTGKEHNHYNRWRFFDFEKVYNT